MRRFGVGSLVAFILMAIGLAGASEAEDSLGLNVNCGSSCGVGTAADGNTLLAAVPGSLFVVTVAHFAPSVEDAGQGNRPVNCRPFQFRVDTLHVLGRDGTVEVELGQKQELAPGKSVQVIHNVDTAAPGVGAAMDQMTFRLRASRVSPLCDVVASGMFFEDATSTKTTPFSVLLDDGTKRQVQSEQN